MQAHIPVLHQTCAFSHNTHPHIPVLFISPKELIMQWELVCHWLEGCAEASWGGWWCRSSKTSQNRRTERCRQCTYIVHLYTYFIVYIMTQYTHRNTHTQKHGVDSMLVSRNLMCWCSVDNWINIYSQIYRYLVLNSWDVFIYTRSTASE